MKGSLEAAEQQSVREKVRAGYAAIAEQGVSPRREKGSAGCGGGTSSCCGATDTDAATRLAETVGYDLEELSALPEGANLGLSCGNPVALASLREGETVLDLGSGGGFDVFVAGRKVGARGRVIGVDMTPEMIARARRNAVAFRKSAGFDNVDFRLGEIEHLPVADESVDVVISNCVLNLSPDKPRVWREIGRVLRPGGRVAVSDLVLKRPLPPAVAQMVEALVGCVAGAALAADVRRMAEDAGLEDVMLEEKAGYVDAMEQWNDPLYAKVKEALPGGARMGDYIASMNISARKAAAGQGCCGSECCQ